MKKNFFHHPSSGRVKDKESVEPSLQREKNFKDLFEEIPVALWVEDFSAVKGFLEELREFGIDDFRAYFTENMEKLYECIQKIKVLDVNKACLDLYEAETKDQLLGNLQQVFTEESNGNFLDEIIALTQGQFHFEIEAINRTLHGTKINLILRWSVESEYRETWGRALVSVIDITKRKQAEHALKESEGQFRLILSKMPGGLYTVDTNLRFTSIFSANLESVGLKPSDFIGKPVNTFYGDQMDEKYVKNYHHRALAGEIIDYNLKIFNRAYLIHLEPIHDAANETIGVIGIAFNVTAQQQAARALRQSEEQLRLVLTHMPGAIFTTDTNLICTSMYSATLHKVGTKDIDCIGKNIIAFFSSFAEGIPAESYYRRVLCGEVVEFDFSTHNWAYLAHLEPLRDADNKIIGVLGIAFNITERKQAERALKQNEEQLRMILNHLPGALYTTDKDLIFTSMFISHLEFMGWQPSDLLGKPVTMFSAASFNEENIRNYHNKALGGEVVNYDVMFKDRAYIGHLEPLHDAGNNIIGVLGLFINITERKRAEEERLQIQRDQQAILKKNLQISELKSNIITQTTHELKTPLTSIYGWANLLHNARFTGKELNAEEEREGLKSILRNAERMIDLINDFLDMSRLESGHIELNRVLLDFGDILTNALQAVDYLAIQKRINFQVELGPANPISVDRQRMEQVLINLLSNAVKYSPDETTVTITTSTKEDCDCPTFCIQIIDHGYGFTPEELADAITPFGKANTQQSQKLNIQGTGLGLFISHGIVEQHGGTMTINSKGPNQGTIVEILLPLHS